MSEAITRGIRVQVKSSYVEARSAPLQGIYFFAYHVRIKNEGDVPVQLLSRRWTITDGIGRTEEVRGPGVVGAQPRLAPGETFEYTSFCPLKTEIGSMNGTYQMQTAAGERFEAQIHPFTLALPHALN